MACARAGEQQGACDLQAAIEREGQRDPAEDVTRVGAQDGLHTVHRTDAHDDEAHDRQADHDHRVALDRIARHQAQGRCGTGCAPDHQRHPHQHAGRVDRCRGLTAQPSDEQWQVQRRQHAGDNGHRECERSVQSQHGSDGCGAAHRGRQQAQQHAETDAFGQRQQRGQRDAGQRHADNDPQQRDGVAPWAAQACVQRGRIDLEECAQGEHEDRCPHGRFHRCRETGPCQPEQHAGEQQRRTVTACESEEGLHGGLFQRTAVADR